MSEILVVGSLAYDSIQSPAGKVDRTLGGSANYFSLAASLYAEVCVVGVVGDDYAEEDLRLLQNRKVNTQGLQKVPGKTFHWAGRYQDDMNEAITLATDLNVFAHFNPALPADYRKTPYVFLANIDPELQLSVLSQVEKPKIVGSDTMNFWISSKMNRLKEVLAKVDVLLVNENEAKAITQTANGVLAAEEILKMGPKAVVVKRGEYGFLALDAQGYFILPAFPIGKVIDPTGAGDSFAGAFFGYLAKSGLGLEPSAFRAACVHGCLAASFTVESFGVDRLRQLNWADLETRQQKYQKVIRL